MAKFNTPSLQTEFSSVFMTPSSSSGKPVFHAPKALLTPLPLSFASPAHTPQTRLPQREEHKDILTELFEEGCPLIAKMILSHLNQDDIAKCLSVCKSWNEHISTWHPLPSKPISESTDICDENSEEPILKSSTGRFPLSMISNQSRRHGSPSKENTALSVKPSHCRMTKCPRCQSPAKALNIRRAECTRAQCQYDFCQHCFQSWHDNPSCGITPVATSPKKTKHIAGTKKSKRNLRRL